MTTSKWLGYGEVSGASGLGQMGSRSGWWVAGHSVVKGNDEKSSVCLGGIGRDGMARLFGWRDRIGEAGAHI